MIRGLALRARLWLVLFFVQSARALWLHRARSALSALGIQIGIAAFVLVVAIGRTGAQKAEAELAKLGDNLVWVEAGSRNAAGVRTGTHGMTNLTIEDMQTIRREVKLVKSASPNVDFTAQVAFGDRNWNTHLRGVSPEYRAIKSWSIADGAYFTDEDVTAANNVCVIGATVRAQLFGDAATVVGETIHIGAQLFVVVGTLAPKGQSQTGRDQDDEIHLPYTTLETKLRGGGIVWLDDLLFSAVSREAVHESVGPITAVMRERHAIVDGRDDDFNIRHPETVIDAQIEASHTLAIFLTSIASIALGVGGIGIMNVMLASVSQRTREIGLRLAIGARRSAVVSQFLGEAALLGAFGGLAGVATSFVGAAFVGELLAWSLDVKLDSMLVGLAFALAVGMFFGAYPAVKASRLDPIVALRSE